MSSRDYKGGLLPSTQLPKARLADFPAARALPAPPVNFGHEHLVASDKWGFLGNNLYGDCLLASAAHQTLLWNLEQGRRFPFTDKATIGDYSRLTGFDPAHPETDQGATLIDVAEFRRTVGVADATGVRHKITAYVGLGRGDLTDLAMSAWLFGAAEFGFLFPRTAFDQFDARQPWDVVEPDGGIAFGHAVPIIARRNGLYWCVCWGRLQALTPGFYAAYCLEGMAYLSLERLEKRVPRRGPVTYTSPEGIELAGLLADLDIVGR